MLYHLAAMFKKTFGEIKILNKMGENARTRTINIEEFKKLLDKSKGHTRNFIMIACNTGMRLGEIRQLRWSYKVTKYPSIRTPAK